MIKLKRSVTTCLLVTTFLVATSACTTTNAVGGAGEIKNNLAMDPARAAARKVGPTIERDLKPAFQELTAMAQNSMQYLEGDINTELTQRCEEGESSICIALGFAFLRGESVPKDAEKSMALFERSCNQADVYLKSNQMDLFDSNGCMIAGILHTGQFTEDIKANTNQSREMLQQGCLLKNAESCLILGGLINEGVLPVYPAANAGNTNAGNTGTVSIDQINQEVLSAYKTGCTLGDGRGCRYVGDLVTAGIDGAADIPQRAFGFYALGCNGFDEASCRSAIELYENNSITHDAEHETAIKRVYGQYDTLLKSKPPAVHP